MLRFVLCFRPDYKLELHATPHPSRLRRATFPPGEGFTAAPLIKPCFYYTQPRRGFAIPIFANDGKTAVHENGGSIQGVIISRRYSRGEAPKVWRKAR